MVTEFGTEAQGDRVVVAGEIDMATAPELRDALAAADRHGRLTVDLSAVSYLDSAGVAVLFDHVPRGLELIVAPGSPVGRVLDLTGLTGVATIRVAGSDGATRHDGARHDGARHDGARHDGARHDGARHDGATRPGTAGPDGTGRSDGPSG